MKNKLSLSYIVDMILAAKVCLNNAAARLAAHRGLKEKFQYRTLERDGYTFMNSF